MRNALAPAAGPPRLAALHQRAPAPRLDLHAKAAGSLSDPLPRAIPLGIRDAFDLVESRHRVAHVARVVDRLLALAREGEHLAGHAVATPRARPVTHPLYPRALGAPALNGPRALDVAARGRLLSGGRHVYLLAKGYASAIACERAKCKQVLLTRATQTGD